MMTAVLRPVRLLIFGFVGAASLGAQATPPATEGEGGAVFATVNGEPILRQTYETAVRIAGRQRFYHGRPPQAELEAFRRQVGEQLVEERLLHQEAVARGIQPDGAWVAAELEKITGRYGGSPQWHEDREALQRQLREGLEQRSRIQRLEEVLRQIDDPTEAELEAYYRAYPDKFTSPERIRVTTLLLNVEPWAPPEAWDEKRALAEELLMRVRQGEDFSTLVRDFGEYGDDPNEYIHRGIFGETAQQVIDALNESEISDVVTLLEGIAIFRLDERLPTQLNPLDRVRARATELWLREQRKVKRQQVVEALRRRASIEIVNRDYYKIAVPAAASFTRPPAQAAQAD
jgi:hypothetical protein